jgi:hypothetical protein
MVYLNTFQNIHRSLLINSTNLRLVPLQIHSFFNNGMNYFV